MDNYRVFVTSQHPGDAVELLSAKFKVDANLDRQKPSLTAPELLKALKGQDAVICILQDAMSDAVMAAFPELKVIANVAVGYDNIDVEAATRRGILVTNTPGVLDETTADLAFGLLMACARRIAEGDRYIRDGQWKGFQPDLMSGLDVYGKTLGIVGYGRIGQAMVRRGQGFGMKILYTRRSQPNDAEAKKEGEPQAVPLDELLAKSDFVSLHCPLNKETRHLIGKRQLSLMKSDAILINTARGAVVDQGAVITALANGQLYGAGLDVFDDEPDVPDELKQMQNVVLTPHIGSASLETRSAMARLAAQAVLSALGGNLPANAVNPKIWPAFLDRLKAANTSR
jgi:glyoxylate reductase